MIKASELLKKENLHGINVYTHPAFENMPTMCVLDKEMRDRLIAVWNIENCEFKFFDGEFQWVLNDTGVGCE